jgi:hypothetical protein
MGRWHPWRVLKVVDIKPLAPHRCGLESRQGFGLFHVRKLPNRTSVVLLRCPFVLEIIHRRAPEVFIHQYSLKDVI